MQRRHGSVWNGKGAGRGGNDLRSIDDDPECHADEARGQAEPYACCIRKSREIGQRVGDGLEGLASG